MFNILCSQIFVHGMSHFRYFADYSTRAKCNQGFLKNEVLWLNLGILTALLKIFSHFILWHKIHTYKPSVSLHGKKHCYYQVAKWEVRTSVNQPYLSPGIACIWWNEHRHIIVRHFRANISWEMNQIKKQICVLNNETMLNTRKAHSQFINQQMCIYLNKQLL